jgi:hypothetical protein
MRHTPGPWKAYDIGSFTPHIGTVSADPKAGWRYDTICSLYEYKREPYASCSDDVPCENHIANARLIVAAPDLLEALEALHACHRAFSSNDNWTSLDDDAREAAEAAIAKAKGENK